MCRWIAYRGETVALEHYVTAPAHSLIEQSMRAVEALSGINGDGFGLGWYAGHEEPGLYREVRPAWSDENLRHLCRHIRSHLFFAHVRASTGTATTRPNCHPFAHGRWMFMHNGQFGDWSLIRRQAEALIPDAFYRSRVGTTDWTGTRIVSGSCATSIRSPWHNHIACSTTFCSSRTLPGHRCRFRHNIASSVMWTRRPVRSTKCATSTGMSSRRSRSGGTSMWITRRR